jgi:DNA-binding FrmR family transcriptional regulator
MKHTTDLINRLKKIQGQIETLKRVIKQEDKTCADIVYQIKTVKSARKKFGDIYIKVYNATCVEDGRDQKESATEASEARKTVLKA